MDTIKILRSILDTYHVEFGSSSDDWIHDSERMGRCSDAAEDGADGSTHSEILQDYRDTFDRVIPSHCERLQRAANAWVSELERWHIANGTIDEQVG